MDWWWVDGLVVDGWIDWWMDGLKDELMGGSMD